jgi:GT2 family glycosyltransferase
MTDSKVTVLIPNYKTPEVTRLCLRMLRKNTPTDAVRVIVIDNDSADDSLAYLKSLDWIELIERKGVVDDTPSQSESRALDLALERVQTPYVLAIHTDTLVKDPRWLEVLLEEIEGDDTVAGVGSWKLETPPGLGKCLAKTLEYRLRLLRYSLAGDRQGVKKVRDQIDGGYYRIGSRQDAPRSGEGREYYFLRSHCALYRMDLIHKYNLTFSQNGETASKGMSKYLVEQGYRLVYLSARHLSDYLMHLNHATMVFHPELGSGDRTIRKGLRRIRRILKELDADRILADASLDR